MKNKKTKGLLTLLLVIAPLFGGTLAWRDMNQHKTNKFTTTEVQNNVVLVETFKEKENWKKGEIEEKLVSVRNGQDDDKGDEYSFDDAYVRINFKEFMGLDNTEYEYTKDRMMVDTLGNFVKGKTQADVEGQQHKQQIFLNQ